MSKGWRCWPRNMPMALKTLHGITSFYLHGIGSECRLEESDCVSSECAVATRLWDIGRLKFSEPQFTHLKISMLISPTSQDCCAGKMGCHTPRTWYILLMVSSSGMLPSTCNESMWQFPPHPPTIPYLTSYCYKQTLLETSLNPLE